MKTLRTTISIFALLAIATVAAAQSAPGVPPTLLPLSGQLLTGGGQPRTGTAQLTIALYAEQSDPAPVWLEIQVVNLDSAGRYSVSVGSTLHDGLPASLFDGTTTTARWIGVTVDSEAEQPRMILVSVPYAVRAATADTLGGKSADDFVLKTHGGDVNTSSCVGCPTLTSPTITEVLDGNGNGILGVGSTTPRGVLDAVETRGVSANLYLQTQSANDAIVRFINNNQQWSFGLQAGTNTFSVRDVTNFADRLTIVPGTGFVGVGTNNPQFPFHMAGTGSQNFMFEATGVNPNDAAARFKNSAQQWQFGLRADVANGFVIRNVSTVTDQFVLTTAGRVGIGTMTPTEALDVQGNINVSGNINAKYQDVAEWVDSREPLEAGTVVVIDPSAKNHVAASGRAYATSVAGAISAQPGVVLGEGGEGRVLVAQSGRVRIKADARYGAIKAGDLLVSSPVKGYAMRSKPIMVNGVPLHRPGTVLGKALEALPNGRGEILVLLTLQ